MNVVPTFSVRPRSSVGRVTVDLIRRSWVRFPPRSKDFFFTSCGSLFPFTRANAQWDIHGFISTLIYTSELILRFIIFNHCCSFMVYCSLFGAFLHCFLVNYIVLLPCFQLVCNQLKVTQNTAPRLSSTKIRIQLYLMASLVYLVHCCTQNVLNLAGCNLLLKNLFNVHLNVTSCSGQVTDKMQQELHVVTFGMTQHEARLTWLICGLT